MLRVVENAVEMEDGREVSPLDELAREGARRMLAQALEAAIGQLGVSMHTGTEVTGLLLDLGEYLEKRTQRRSDQLMRISEQSPLDIPQLAFSRLDGLQNFPVEGFIPVDHHYFADMVLQPGKVRFALVDSRQPSGHSKFEYIKPFRVQGFKFSIEILDTE